MKAGETLSILSHMINFTILVYFAAILLKANALDLQSLAINFFGIFISLIANIISVIEKNK